MSAELLWGKCRVSVEKGDITAYRAEAIVNAANSSLLGGGGVDGAIHRVGGPDILTECKLIRSKQSGCPAGEAVITTAGKLMAKRVIHTVGPIWRGGNSGEAAILASCYQESLNLARTEELRTIAFPSISTGAYGYPVEQAAKIALTAAHRFLSDNPGSFDRITWVLFDEHTYQTYAEQLRRIAD